MTYVSKCAGLATRVLAIAIPCCLLTVCPLQAQESFYISDMDGSGSCMSSEGLGDGGCASCNAGANCDTGVSCDLGAGAAVCGAAGCGTAGGGGCLGCGLLAGRLLNGQLGCRTCGGLLKGGGGCALCSGLLSKDAGIPADGSHCGLPAPKYPVPFATPRPTTPTHLMYPPMMPQFFAALPQHVFLQAWARHEPHERPLAFEEDRKPGPLHSSLV